MGVLDELVARAHRRAQGLGNLPLSNPNPHVDFRDAIAGKDRISVIAEFKRCSPSLGQIRTDADITRQVKNYIEGGASAISVLTEPTRFRGSYEDLRFAVAAGDAPALMKDFVVSPRQVELAASLGASAVLLIVRCLPGPLLGELVESCRQCQLTPMIECHEKDEIEIALEFEDAVIGVNHRNLSTLAVDMERGRELMKSIPRERVVVSESGVQEPEDVRHLRGLVDAVLIGTALMRAARPQDFLQEVLS
jgi:indole-3-glycerol phosphate synthase